jgi:hypothetical protein
MTTRLSVCHPNNSTCAKVEILIIKFMDVQQVMYSCKFSVHRFGLKMSTLAMTSPNKLLCKLYNVDHIHLRINNKSIIFTYYRDMDISSSVSSVSFNHYWSCIAQTDQHVKQQMFTTLNSQCQIFYIYARNNMMLKMLNIMYYICSYAGAFKFWSSTHLFEYSLLVP